MKYLEEIKKSMESEVLYETDELLNKVKQEEKAADYIEPLLRFMEENPDIDFGMPGPVVHFMESLDGYEELLIESINRKPISHTVWMLNRVLNDPTSKNRKKYLKLMKEQVKRGDLPDDLKDEIREYIAFQEERIVE